MATTGSSLGVGGGAPVRHDRGDMNRRGQKKNTGGPAISFMPDNIKRLFEARPAIKPFLVPAATTATTGAAVLLPPASSSLKAGELVEAVDESGGTGGDSDATDATTVDAALATASVDMKLDHHGEEDKNNKSAAVATMTCAVAHQVAENDDDDNDDTPFELSRLTGVSSFLSHLDTLPPAVHRPIPPSLEEQRATRRSARVAAAATKVAAAITAWKPMSDPNISGNALATLFIGHLPLTCDERRLAAEFSGFGEVVNVRVVRDEAGKSRRYGFIEFAREVDVKVRNKIKASKRNKRKRSPTPHPPPPSPPTGRFSR